MSVFSFEFAALDYTAPDQNQYRYKLEGFDSDWIEASNRRFATYTNLDGGNYVFRVRGSNNYGVWNEASASIPIQITPPPWQTGWAYLVYVLVGVGLVLGYVQYRTSRQAYLLAEQRRELERERLVAEQLRRVDRLKDEFLANTSHELRTVASTVGVGSQFTFTMPLASEKPPPPQLQATDGVIQNGDTTLPATGITTIAQAIPDETPISSLTFRAQESTVLVVDDEPVNQRVVANYLSLPNQPSHKIVKAMSGLEALQLVTDGLVPDLVLLDVMMPHMSGLEVCYQLRQKYGLHELPILMLTAKNQVGDVVAGFEVGANDYLPKPFSRPELLARIDTLLTLKQMVRSYRQLELMEQEMEVARSIQQAILPAGVPQLKGVNIEVRYLPMASVGGDYYDFYVLDDTRLGVIVADVSGHGVPAALIAAMVKIAFTAQKQHAHSASMVLTGINHTLCGHIGRQLLTAGYFYLNLANKKLLHARAGHWPLLIWKKNQQTLLNVAPQGIIIGWIPEIDYRSEEVEVESGDRIILYTDAVIEAVNVYEDFFGEEQFHQFIADNQALSAADFADALIERLKEWTGLYDGLDDDLTLVVVDIL